MLLGVLLLAILVGVVGARPNAGHAAAGRKVIVVPSAACVPENDLADWEHFTNYVECDTAPCWFACAFDLPAEGPGKTVTARVKKLVAYVYDNDGGGDVTIYLFKTDPKTTNSMEMARVKSAGASGTDPQALTDASINFNPVRRKNGTHVWLYLTGTDIRVYGVRIVYTR